MTASLRGLGLVTVSYWGCMLDILDTRVRLNWLNLQDRLRIDQVELNDWLGGVWLIELIELAGCVSSSRDWDRG